MTAPVRPLALVGLFVAVFAVLALSGPGRIDIVDGQPRYEAARSLVEHGDVELRDPHIWYGGLPGRDGRTFNFYRLPQTLLGVPAIGLADATGRVSEARRHFFFMLTSAAAGAAIAVAYAIWFSSHGFGPRAAVGWAVLGVFCTPVWYYSTSAFDDVLGTAASLLAITSAWLSRRGSWGWAAAAGLWLGTAFHCKQPLGVMLLPALAAALATGVPWRRQLGRLGLIVLGVVAGYATYRWYEWYRFPDGMPVGMIQFDPPARSHNPPAALLVLLISPAAGVIWYAPSVVLSVFGWLKAWREERPWAAAVGVAVAVFTGFLCTLGFFKGDIGWGPRYLTPLVALGWLFVPAGAAALGAARGRLILAAAFVVQLFSLGADPHRLYLRADLHPTLLFSDYQLYYDLRSSHLAWRPVEVWEELTTTATAERYTPAPAAAPPTYALPSITDMIGPDGARAAVTRFQVFNRPRPWWANQWRLSPAERPVDLARTAAVFIALAAGGGLLLALGLRSRRMAAS